MINEKGEGLNACQCTCGKVLAYTDSAGKIYLYCRRCKRLSKLDIVPLPVIIQQNISNEVVDINTQV